MWTLTGPLRGTASNGGNFSFQVNGYSPNGYTPAYMQWVLLVENSGVYFQVYYIQSSDGVLIYQSAQSSVYNFHMSDFAVGTTIAITVNTNSTGDVVSASGAIKLSSGTTTFLASEAITTYSPAVGSQEGTGNAQAPVIGFEAQLIGDGGADTATFTQASGTITYSSSTALVASPTPVGISYVQYNGANKGTVEKSNIAYGVVTSQTTTSTGCTGSSTIICTSYPPAFGMDVGPALWGFNAKGFWFMSGTSNTTLSLVTWVGLVGPTAVPNHKCGSALVWSFSHNSTTYIYTGVPPSAVACSGSSLTPLVHLYISNVTGAYNQKEISGSVSTLRTGVAQFVKNQILFSLTSTAAASACDSKPHVVAGMTIPPCASQQFGQTAFSWPAIATPAYNNATHILTANSTVSLVSGAPFAFDPLAVDGASGSTEYCVTCSSLGVSLTTANANDVVIVEVATDCNTAGGCPIAVSTVTDGTNTYHLRTSTVFNAATCTISTNCEDEEEWYAVWASSGTHTVTVTLTGSTYILWESLIGISGANTAGPLFDTNAAIPSGTSTSSSVTSFSQTISTSNANDFLVSQGFFGDASQTGPSGFTAFGNTNSQHNSYKIVSATLSSATETWSWTGVAQFGMLFDAIQQASSGVTTALDGSAVASSNSASTLTCTLSTSSTNDIIIVAFDIFAENLHAFTSVSDSGGAGLTWNARVTALNGQPGDGYLYEYYAKSAGALTSDPIKLSVASSTYLSEICWGVSGADQTTIWDTNGGIPFTNTHLQAGATTNTSLTSFSTSNANDFVFSITGSANVGPSHTANTGFSLIQDQHVAGTGVDVASFYKVVSATYSTYHTLWIVKSTGAAGWAFIGDAIMAAGSAGVTTTLTFSPSVSLSAGFAQSVAAAFNVPSQPTISTVTTETAGNAQTGFNAQVTVLYGAGLYWAFYVPTSGVITYSTSSDALSWSAGTALAGWPGNSPQDWSIYSSGTTVYIVGVTGAGNFDWRYGTLTSGGTITWTIGITSVASLYTTRANPYITVDGSGNVWVADTEYAAGPVYYLEVYENVGGSWSNVYSHLNDFGIQSVIPLANGGVSLIWQDASTGAISILGWSGSAWSSPSSPSSIYSTQWSATAISNTIYFVGEDAVVGNVRFWSSVYPFSSVSAETILNSGTTNEWASVTTDGSSKLVAVYAPSSTTMDYRVSLNSGASWGPERSITTTEASITNGDGNTFPRMNGNIGYGEFTEGTGSPWSIRFFTIDTTSPSILLSAAFEQQVTPNAFSVGLTLTPTFNQQVTPGITASESITPTFGLSNSAAFTPSISDTATFDQQVQPNPFAVGIVLTPFFSTGVVPVITFTATIGLSATFDQGVTPNLGGLGITLTPIFVAVPCIGCGGNGTTTTITTTSTTGGHGTSQNFKNLIVYMVFFVIFGFLVIVLYATRRSWQ